MFIKLYEAIKKYIKEQYKFLVFLFLVLIISVIRLPFFIDTPGGILSVADRIKIDDKKINGSLNYAYVSELRATIPTYLFSFLNPNWDLVKIDDTLYENENLKEANFRDELSLKESMSDAVYAGFSMANKEFRVVNNKIFVTAILKEAKTDLMVGDQILKIDDVVINSKNDLKYINNKNVSDNVIIEVIRNDKKIKCHAELISNSGKVIVGVGIGNTYDIDSSYNLDIKYSSRESGPSGGLMTALSVYSYLTDTDLARGRKIVGTGTIDTDLNVGDIGGVKYKLIGAVRNHADVFLVPNGENYEEAIKIKKDKGYAIKIVGVSTLGEAINELIKD